MKAQPGLGAVRVVAQGGGPWRPSSSPTGGAGSGLVRRPGWDRPPPSRGLIPLLGHAQPTKHPPPCFASPCHKPDRTASTNRLLLCSPYGVCVAPAVAAEVAAA